MRLRGLDLEATPELFERLRRGLRELSNRAAALSSELAPEHQDAVAYIATNTARLAVIVDVLQDRESSPPTPRPAAIKCRG